jgi:hypothetical protein
MIGLSFVSVGCGNSSSRAIDPATATAGVHKAVVAAVATAHSEDISEAKFIALATVAQLAGHDAVRYHDLAAKATAEAEKVLARPAPSMTSTLGAVVRPAPPEASTSQSGSSQPNLLDLNGNGNYKSKSITTPPTGWHFTYSYTCKPTGVAGYFEISVGDPTSPLSSPQQIVFETNKAAKSGDSGQLAGGQWFLQVETFGNTCSWHITVPKS